MRRRCLCHCHEDGTDRCRADGVDVTDAIAAVTACPSCQNAHVDALLDEPPGRVDLSDVFRHACDDPPPPGYLPPTAWDGEGDE